MFEILNKTHDRQSFDCGNEPMNAYLKTMANQHAKKGMSVTHILAQNDAVGAFYTLSNMHINNDERKLAGYPSEVPAILIGRIGVNKPFQGQGLLKEVLKDALKNVIQLAKISGIAFVVVDAKTDQLVKFYQSAGFVSLADRRLVPAVNKIYKE